VKGKNAEEKRLRKRRISGRTGEELFDCHQIFYFDGELSAFCEVTCLPCDIFFYNTTKAAGFSTGFFI